MSSKTPDEIERLEQVEQEIADADLMALMKTPHGKRFVWRILGVCKVFQECNTGNSQTFTNLGRRSVGLWLMEQLTEVCPEEYLEMYQQQLMYLRNQNQQEEESDG